MFQQIIDHQPGEGPAQRVEKMQLEFDAAKASGIELAAKIKGLKEQVTDELLPRAFSIVRSTWTWIDPVNGWLIVDAGSPGKAEEVLKLLLKAIPKFPLETLRTVRSPLSSMTDWLASDEAPSGFTVDQDTELRASGDSKATQR